MRIAMFCLLFVTGWSDLLTAADVPAVRISVKQSEQVVGRHCPPYPLGAGDQLLVRSLNGEQINETVIVADDGTIRLPLLGQLTIGGMSTEEVQRGVNEQLKAFIRSPNVSVSLATPQSRHVSVIGSVTQPGVRVIHGCTNLIDVISQAGGLQPDAGNTIEIMRPVSQLNGGPAQGDAAPADRKYSVIPIRVADLIEARRPEANIPVQPGDVISVRKTQLVYVVGAVQKPGGFVLNERESLSALQALSLAGGLAPSPSPQNARILRDSTGEKRTEIAVNMKKILSGKTPDVQLRPDDILFIPTSTMQKATARTLEAMIQAATGIVIWR